MKTVQWIRYRLACLWWDWCPKHRCEKVSCDWPFCAECQREKFHRKKLKYETAREAWHVRRELP